MRYTTLHSLMRKHSMNIGSSPFKWLFDSKKLEIVTIEYIIELEQCWSDTKKLAY